MAAIKTENEAEIGSKRLLLRGVRSAGMVSQQQLQPGVHRKDYTIQSEQSK
jgi:hypothetical protein